MPSFTTTLTALLSILSDVISKNQSMEVFCSKFKSLESVHRRFYPILSDCYEFSEKGFKENLKKELVKNLRKFRDISGEEEMSDEQLIEAYMDMNKYYPVTFGSGSASSPEKGKLNALKEFENYVKYISGHLNKQGFLKNKISNRFVPKIYFSDDDKKNLEFTHKKLSDRPENIIQFISTHGGERKKYDG